jgi:hypothetical protein
VEAIPASVMATAIYNNSKWAVIHHMPLNLNTIVSEPRVVEMAKSAGDVSYVKAVEEYEMPASINVKDARSMVMLALNKDAAAFMKARAITLKMLEDYPKIEYSDVGFVLYKGYEEVYSKKCSAGNMVLYKAYHRIHHHEDASMYDPISSFETFDQLNRYFEETRTKDYFMEAGKRLKDAMRDILEWIKKTIAES